MGRSDGRWAYLLTRKRLLSRLKVLHDSVDSARDDVVRKIGRPVSCKVGCSACCRYLSVFVGLGEAYAMVVYAEEHNIDVDVPKLEAAAMQYRDARDGPDFASRGVVCPLLVDDRCSVHPARPMSCRNWLALSDPGECRVNGHQDIVDITEIHNSSAHASASFWAKGGLPDVQGPLPIMVLCAMRLRQGSAIPVEYAFMLADVASDAEWAEKWESQGLVGV